MRECRCVLVRHVLAALEECILLNGDGDALMFLVQFYAHTSFLSRSAGRRVET